MNTEAKNELARAILETIRVRESSWQPELGRYRITHHEAAPIACDDPAIAELVGVICALGYCDFPDWAEKQLGMVTA